MKDSPIAAWVLFAVVVWGAGYMLACIRWFVVPALGTGVLQARGRTYSRAGEPVRFWGGITFWIVMGLVMSLFAIAWAVELWRTFVA